MGKKLNLSKYKKRFCFDLDGVLCKTKKNYYQNSIPIKTAIKIVNKLYDRGNYILIYTSRYMGRSKDKLQNSETDFKRAKNAIDRARNRLKISSRI